MEEIWKDIKGYEGLYQVSNLGRVKSLGRYQKAKLGSIQYRGDRLLKPWLRKDYLTVRLVDNGKGKNYSIHRLVAEAFIDNPDNLPCVNHKDFNTKNNVATNLEYCTVLYNNCYGDRLKRQAASLSETMLERNKRKRAA